MIDPEDIAYEDSVSSETYDYEEDEEGPYNWFSNVSCISYEEDSRDYETWSPEDCVAENVGEF